MGYDPKEDSTMRVRTGVTSEIIAGVESAKAKPAATTA